jgi:uncharacterized protein
MLSKPAHKLLMLVCISVAMTACKATKESVAPSASTMTAAATLITAAATAPDRHFLWRISKGRDSLYLVGSVHALNPDDYPLPQAMETAFQNSSALVEEINLTTVDSAAMQQEALRVGAYPPGKSLRDELPPDVYGKVATEAQKLGIDMQRLDKLRPWLGSIAILDMQLKQAGYTSSAGVDHHFADEAQMRGKRVIGLETPRFQLRLLADLPAKVQQDMLLQSLDQAVNFAQEMQQLINAWEKGDTAGLEKILKQDFGSYPQAYKLLIADRNRAWMPELKRLMLSGRRYFVVVGALHMVGADGLLARFKKEGYKVDQL